MKKLIHLLIILFLSIGCKQNKKSEPVMLHDGFYEVIKADTTYSTLNDTMQVGQMIVRFDTIFNPKDYTKILIDTSDFVALELEVAPTTEQQTESKKLLSISLTPEMAEKVKNFTSKRLMKQVAIVLDNKAITMHKIREAITGNKIQITRCNDNACEYLYTKMKNRVNR